MKFWPIAVIALLPSFVSANTKSIMVARSAPLAQQNISTGTTGIGAGASSRKAKSVPTVDPDNQNHNTR
jgi:hypothetical protein